MTRHWESLQPVFLMPVWPLWQMSRQCEKSSHSQTCATDSPGGFVKTWIARPILRVSDLVGLEWLTSSPGMQMLQVQGLLFENHCMRTAHHVWWWLNLGQGVEGSSALPVLFFSIQNSWGKQSVKNSSNGYATTWNQSGVCVCWRSFHHGPIA